MSHYRAVFRCAAGCAGEYSIWKPIYRCPTCGDLLQVDHDLDAPILLPTRGVVTPIGVRVGRHRPCRAPGMDGKAGRGEAAVGLQPRNHGAGAMLGPSASTVK